MNYCWDTLVGATVFAVDLLLAADQFVFIFVVAFVVFVDMD